MARKKRIKEIIAGRNKDISSPSPVRGLIALIRLPYWMMTGGLAVLTAFAILKGNFADIPTLLGPMNIGLVALLTFFSMSFIASGGFAINDYYDRESDTVIKPKRPIPSGALSYKQAIAISGIFFALGLAMSVLINWLAFAIIATDSLLLLVYSYLIKRKSGFAANLLMGVLTGTTLLYGEATATGTVSVVSLSLYPMASGTIGGNILRDIFSLEGDAKVGSHFATENRQYERCKSWRSILPLNRVTGGFALLHRGIHGLLSTVNSDVEYTVNLFSNTTIHFRHDCSGHT
jgi:4-hydroxybenzoate polyprenyltransferase